MRVWEMGALSGGGGVVIEALKRQTYLGIFLLNVRHVCDNFVEV